jgi:hypothetical protein
MGQAGQARALAHFTLDGQIERFNQILLEEYRAAHAIGPQIAEVAR